MCYLRRLRAYVKEHGSDDIVYVDESGFLEHTHRTHGWAKRGVQIHADIKGNNRKRTNLIMAKRKDKWLAPMLFEGGCHKELVNTWIEKMLLKELRPNSLVIWDNAAFHDKKKITAILEQNGHKAWFLPPYSPDFNPIEKAFANIKKLRLNNYSLELVLMRNT